MLRRAAQEPDDNTVGGAAALFSVSFWTDKTKSVLHPLYAALQALARQDATEQFGTAPDPSADHAVESELERRAETLAAEITNTTFSALQRIVSQNSTVDAMVKAVKRLFQTARRSRAKTIATTEVAGALNAGVYTFGRNLPAASVPYHRTWVTMHDSRVRLAHREADGQVRAIEEPFTIGGFPAQYPGDPALPPSLSINCRCHLVYAPGSVTT